MIARLTLMGVLLLGPAGAWAAQQGVATAEPLSIRTVSLPKAILRQQYRSRLEAQGGIAPVSWTVTKGQLPAGLALNETGQLSGVPSQTGEFRFTITVTDSGKPPSERSKELVLQVVAPLLAKWSRYPRTTGQKVEGAIEVSNETGEEFDLTVIILAVNQIGRATAVAYQHFTLLRNTLGLEIPFAETLTRGTYELNADVVAEVHQTGTIYRARLVTERLQVLEGP